MKDQTKIQDETKVDPRVKNTRKTVRSVFLNLLREKPLHKITVKEICEQAQINRTTFYKHYMDVYDLMDQTEQYILQLFQQWMEGMKHHPVEEVLTGLLTNMKENILQYEALFGPHGNPGLLNRIAASCYPLFRRNTDLNPVSVLNDDIEKMSYAYISSGCSGILGYWMRFHFEQSPAEVAHLILQMVDLTMKGIDERFRT